MQYIDEYNDEYGFARPYLSEGETILWKGKPEKGHMFTSQDIFMIPFSIIWCGFAIFWETTAIISGAPFFFALWGIPFVCVGLYMVFGRFFWTAHVRKNTAYVITTRRIIRSRRGRVDSMSARSLPPMHAKIRRDGTGTIRFGVPTYYRRNSFDPNDGLFTLENIPDAIRVQRIIENMER